MKHVFTFILSGTKNEAQIHGRLSAKFDRGLTNVQQREQLDDLVRALKHAGITAAPKLPEPHR
jgi:hypothetical protein